MLIALRARQCVSRGTGQKLHCAKPPAGLDQIGDTARIRTRYAMLFIVIRKQGSARHIECLRPGLRPDTERLRRQLRAFSGSED